MPNIKPIENIYDLEFRQLIFAFWQELMPKAAVLETTASREAYFEREFAAGEVYGAWIEHQLIGYIHLHIRDHIGSVEGFYVTPQARRQGHGTAMMQWIFDQFDQRGVQQIDLYVRRDNPGAKAFYEALGFGVASYRMRMYRENGQPMPGALSSDA